MNKPKEPEPTLFNLNHYTKPINPFDLDNGDADLEDFPPIGKNLAYTAGMKVGQVIELESGKRGMVIAIIDGRHVRAYFPGESPIKVCADDFSVVPGVRVHFCESCTLTQNHSDSVRVHLEAETQEKRTLTQLAGEISQLPLSDLHELKAIIDGLIQAMQPEANETTNSQRGHFELKRVKGYGPYRYLRYWSNGKHCSVYLGKSSGD